MMMAAPSRARLQDGVLHPPDADGVEAGEGFVKVNHPRRVQQPAGDGQLLLHAARELARQGVAFPGSSSSSSSGSATGS